MTAREALGGFAADLGGTKIAAARIERGVVVERLLTPTEAAAGPDAQVAAIGALLGRLGHRREAPLGVAVAGRIDGAGQWHAVNAGTLPAIAGFALHGAVEHAIGPATCLNDAAAAALAESCFGAGRGANGFAYLTVSTGVGGGLVLAGRLVRSDSGLAGHVGFVTGPHGAAPCGSGRAGTVEGVAGGRGIAAAARAAGHPVDARVVFDAAVAGEVWAERIVARSAAALATLIGDLTAILGLDAVALGGSIGLAPGYLDRVASALEGEPALFRPRLAPASLGHDAPLIGALAARMDGRIR